jgi:cysteine synthase A
MFDRAASTSVSRALVCAVKRYRLQIVSSDAFAQEKLDHMQLLGAELHVKKASSRELPPART